MSVHLCHISYTVVLNRLVGGVCVCLLVTCHSRPLRWRLVLVSRSFAGPGQLPLRSPFYRRAAATPTARKLQFRLPTNASSSSASERVSLSFHCFQIDKTRDKKLPTLTKLLTALSDFARFSRLNSVCACALSRYKGGRAGQ